jgi:hypothetical protein
MQPTAWIFLLAIYVCSPNSEKTSGANISALMKKPRMQYARGLRRKEDFFKKGIQKLVNTRSAKAVNLTVSEF